MTFKDSLKLLKDLAIREHLTVDDPFYSCPLSSDGPYYDDLEPECNCGATKHNAEVEKMFIETLLAFEDEIENIHFEYLNDL